MPKAKNFHAWLATLFSLVAVWVHIIIYCLSTGYMREHMYIIYGAPIICLMMLGVYALTVVLYRVFTFNDCPEAAAELQEQIVEAKADLAKRGFKFVK